ncbi:hypothetical protein STBA_57310 [Streptomyces sp. MP131-18]|nr:hypothetical protein STBA_57310 [Streptomyces sp. MP131-18]
MPIPSAPAPNALQRPSGASPFCAEKPTNAPGPTSTVTPPANAIVHSPARSDCTARWTATREEEQAVSTDTAGPVRPSVYATRPDSTLIDVPVIRCASEPDMSPPELA